MILVDTNLLVYAYDSSSQQHGRARAWLEGAFTGETPVCLAWQTVLGFLRITTDGRIFTRPRLTPEAVRIVESWFDQPGVRLVQPTERHWAILRNLLDDGQARGPLLMDAHLATLALEHGATLYSTDRDFRRFPELRLVDPLSGN